MTSIILIAISIIVGIWIGHGIGYRYKLSMLQNRIDELMVSLCAKETTIRRYIVMLSDKEKINAILRAKYDKLRAAKPIRCKSCGRYVNAQGFCTKCGG